MKRVLKVILFSFLAVIGAIGVGVGGMYIFGGAEEKPVYASSFSFSESSIKTSTSFSLDITTPDSGVNKTQVVLSVSPGGERIVDFPRTANIGSSFFVVPKRNANGDNIGGTLTLYARYYNDKAQSTAVSSCNILIDVPVKNALVQKTIASHNYGSEAVLCNNGDSLSSLLSVYPSNSLLPYASLSRLSNMGFSAFSDKKIFVSIAVSGYAGQEINPAFLSLDNETDQQGHFTERSALELKYHYDETNGFVFDNKVSVRTKDSNMLVTLTFYVVPTYSIQDDNQISVSSLNNLALVATSSSFYIKDYSVDNMTLSQLSDTKLYVDEEMKFYVNNPSVETTHTTCNLGLSLINNNNITVSDAIVKQNVHMYVYIGQEKTELDMQNKDSAENRCFSYTLTDFEKYYNYSLNGVDSNKIKFEVVYEDVDTEITREILLVPAMDSTHSIVGKTSYTAYNGESFSPFSLVSLSSEKENENIGLEFYVPYSQATIVTLPKSGTYNIKFAFSLLTNSIITNFEVIDNWVSLENSHITFSQNGENKIDCDYDRINVSLDKYFESNVEIVVTITNANIQNDLPDDFRENASNLFKITTSDSNFTIANNMTKFYALEGASASVIPYLKINGVEYSVDFEYFKDADGYSYIHLIKDNFSSSDYCKIQGLGDFSIVAQVVYDYQGKTYSLAQSKTFRVYVIELLKTLTIYDGIDENSAGKYFANTSLEKDENSQGGTLFVTSDELEALKTCVEDGLLNIRVEQVYSISDESLRKNEILKQSNGGNDLDASMLLRVKEMLYAVNRETVTFSSWQAVLDKNAKVVGYSIDYSIGEKYSIFIGDEEVDISFNIYVEAELDGRDNIEGGFAKELSTSPFLSVTVNDKTLKYSYCYYGDKTVTSKEIEAFVDGGEFRWKVDSSEVVASFEKLKFGFKDDENSLNSYYNSMKYKVSLDGIELSHKFYNITEHTTENNKDYVLALNNIPYSSSKAIREVEFKIYSDVISPMNSCYQWNAGTHNFVNKINESISSGASFKFYVKPLYIEISKNPLDIYGSTEIRKTLFSTGNDSVFKINVAVNDYSKLFSVSMFSESNQVAIENNSLVFSSNLLQNENIRFSFTYFGDTSYPIVLSETTSNVATCTALSCYRVVANSSGFTAPSTSQSYGEILFYGASGLASLDNDVVYMAYPTNNYEEGKLYVVLSKDDEEDRFFVDSESGTLSFKTYTEAYSSTINLTLYQRVGDLIKSGTITSQINVTPKYSENELSAPEEVVCGKENKITFGSSAEGDFVLSGALQEDMSKITSVSASFEGESNYIVSAQSHMEQEGFNLDNFAIFSYDLMDDDTVCVTFTFEFNDGGTFVISKTITFLANIKVEFNLGSMRSGERIALSNYSLYTITRGGVQEYLPEEDFQIDNVDRKYFYGPTGDVNEQGEDIFEYSFDFGEFEDYFDIDTEDANQFLVITPKYGEEKNINVSIVFYYKTGRTGNEYIIPVAISFLLSITAN